MGQIRSDVREQHLNSYPSENQLLKPFLPGFYVTWGKRRKAFNTELSVFFLNPESFMTEAFGFEQEVMLVYSQFQTVEPRSIQAAEQFLNDDPARGRVEKLTYFFVSESPGVVEWLREYTSSRQESRLIVPFQAQDLRLHEHDPWHVRNILTEYLYGRDLFDYRLPLERDTYFFGRSDLVLNLHDAAKRSENRGVFGLRKTGKTSLLYKLERTLQPEGAVETFYFDCKLPSIRKLHWNELLREICELICKRLSLRVAISADERIVADSFRKTIETSPKRILLIFDEIEYISPVAIEDKHWHSEFVPFWQVFWACQSRHRKVSALIAGVNPSVVEIDAIEGIQNPLFGIVSYQYLTGLNADDTRTMIRTLGRRMGLAFSPEACLYMFNRYGGHPLLTRIACSILNSSSKLRGESRPIEATPERLKREEEERDVELMFYCRHVVSELKQFYKDEYEMLELLSSGQINDFMELSASLDYTKHLNSYGLVKRDAAGRPSVAIPVVGRYVGLELARQEGRQTLYRVVPTGDRPNWVSNRASAVMRDMRQLESAIRKAQTPPLFGTNSFPEAEKFSNIQAVDDEDGFGRFINTCNRCFVEAIENYGKERGAGQYYWADIKTAYPDLWHALQRVKTYRNEKMHILLNPRASADLATYLKQDLEGKAPSMISDVFFLLEQCVLDGLLTGIQIEMARLN